MRMFLLFAGGLALANALADPAWTQTCGSTAHLSGGHTIAMGGISQEQTQAMVIGRESGTAP